MDMLIFLETMPAILLVMLVAILVLAQDLLFVQHALMPVELNTICSLVRLNAR